MASASNEPVANATPLGPTEAAAVYAAPPAAAASPSDVVAAAGEMPPMQQQQFEQQPAGSISLYVGDLASQDVTEAVLYDVFNKVGQVASIRVCRDSVTRRSLGYAYVNYHSALDAQRALDTMNHVPIKGRPCRIMWSQRDPGARRSNVGNVFIKNLDKSIDNKLLYDTFSVFGNIFSCKVVCDENGSKGYGFVHYETQQAADDAIAKLNGMLLNDKKAFVGAFVPKKERPEAGAVAAFTNVYVKNLPEEINEEGLNKLFEPFGEITSTVLMHDGEGKSRCFGFICFKNAEDAGKAVEALNNKEMDGKTLICNRAQKKSEREAELKSKYDQLKQERLNQYQGVNLYIKNLDDNIDDERLRQAFTPFGTITSTRVMRDEKEASKGFGFVCFSTAEEATKAVTEMNNRIIEKKPLYVGLAECRDVRKQKLDAQHAAQRSGARGMQPMGPGGMHNPVMYAANGMQHMYYNGMVPAGAQGPRYMGMGPQQQLALARPRWSTMPQGPGGPGNAGRQFVQPGVPPFMMQQPGVAAGSRGGAQGRQNPRNGAPTGAPMGAGGPVAVPAGPGAQTGRRYKYNPNVRNPQAMQMGGVPADQNMFSATSLAQADPSKQKQLLGERLFPLIQMNHPNLAAKVTGMLLEMDNSELLHLLESSEALEKKVAEAITVLDMHQQQTAAAACMEEQK